MAPDCGRVYHHEEPGWSDLPATRPQGPKRQAGVRVQKTFGEGESTLGPASRRSGVSFQLRELLAFSLRSLQSPSREF